MLYPVFVTNDSIFITYLKAVDHVRIGKFEIFFLIFFMMNEGWFAFTVVCTNIVLLYFCYKYHSRGNRLV